MSIYNTVCRLYRAVFARRVFRRWNTLLFNLGLRGLGILNYERPEVTGEAYVVARILPRFLNPDDVVVDVGARDGQYAALIRSQFPSTVIHSFEPNLANQPPTPPQNDARLIWHNLALGDFQGSAILYDRADVPYSPHGTLHRDVITSIHRQGVSEHAVQIDTLDNFCTAHNIDRIGFLKIDVEGSELAVLQGAQTLLNDGNIGLIQFEFNEMNVISGTFLRDFRSILPGYRLYRLLPRGLLSLDRASVVLTEIFAFQNILAIPKDLTQLIEPTA